MSKEKVKELKKRIEALIIIGIPKELEAYEFYIELAERADDPPSKEMFMFLAKQELTHRDLLEKMLKELQNSLEEELKMPK
ncbi:MAG: ferritin family protein [Nitrospinota bacterium]